MEVSAALLAFAGALLGGLVNGLTGFGTGMTALPIWAHVLPPVLASPLVVVCSIVGQRQTLPAIWHAIDFRRLRPFVLGGLAGLSGLAPTLWAELRGWEKDARRAVFQGCNLTILVFALASQAFAGLLTAELARLLLLALLLVAGMVLVATGLRGA